GGNRSQPSATTAWTPRCALQGPLPRLVRTCEMVCILWAGVCACRSELPMSRLSRKNLMVDAEKVRELARHHGTTESEAVREAVDYALAAAEVLAALRELRERGGIDDVFGRLP